MKRKANEGIRLEHSRKLEKEVRRAQIQYENKCERQKASESLQRLG